MKKQLFYFGCRKEAGHYLWLAGYGEVSTHRELIPGYSRHLLGYLDGTYIHQQAKQGEYTLVRIADIIILQWPDYTIDKRPGSNSSLIGVGYDNEHEILAAAITAFPDVMTRQPTPVPFINTNPLTY